MGISDARFQIPDRSENLWNLESGIGNRDPSPGRCAATLSRGERAPHKHPRILKVVRWFERWARPRLARILDLWPVKSLLGVFLLAFVAGALLAPPFSGLDTLPSLSFVIVCLGIIFSDAIIVALGLLIGTTGIALVIALGRAAWSLL